MFMACQDDSGSGSGSENTGEGFEKTQPVVDEQASEKLDVCDSYFEYVFNRDILNFRPLQPVPEEENPPNVDRALIDQNLSILVDINQKLSILANENSLSISSNRKYDERDLLEALEAIKFLGEAQPQDEDVLNTMVQVLLTQFENPKDPVLAKIYEAVARAFFDIKPQFLNIQRQLFDIMRRTVYYNVSGYLGSALGNAKPTDDDLLIDIAEMAVFGRNIHTVGFFSRTLVEIQSQSEKLANVLGKVLAKDNRGHIHASRLLDTVMALGHTRSQNSGIPYIINRNRNGQYLQSRSRSLRSFYTKSCRLGFGEHGCRRD